MIDCFDGKYAFLSNFYDNPVTYNGLTYLNNEAAFQAQKTLDEDIRKEFITLPPNLAKRKGRKIALRPDWEEVKETVMMEVFNHNGVSQCISVRNVVVECVRIYGLVEH